LSGLAKPAAQLSPGDHSRLHQRCEKLRSEISALAATMATEGPSSLLVSQILVQCLQTPPGEWLFSVAGQPVLTMWGHTAADLGGGSAKGTGSRDSPEIGVTGQRDPRPASPRPYNFWWILPLAMMLAVIAAAWLLWNTVQSAAQAEVLKLQLANATQTNADLERLLDEKRKPNLRCIPDPDPPKASHPEPDPPKASRPEPDPGQSISRRTRGRVAADPLKIPDGALARNDLSFLSGLWQLGEERVQTYTAGDPSRTTTGSARAVFEFNSAGKGRKHTVERMRHGPDSETGPSLPDQSEAVSVETDGKVLTILVQRGNGRNQRMECIPQSTGEANCTILNNDGHRWEAPLRRIR
jgi:hypothetical protein